MLLRDAGRPALVCLFYCLCDLLICPVIPVFVFDGPHQHFSSCLPTPESLISHFQELIEVFGFFLHQASCFKLYITHYHHLITFRLPESELLSWRTWMRIKVLMQSWQITLKCLCLVQKLSFGCRFHFSSLESGLLHFLGRMHFLGQECQMTAEIRCLSSA